MPKLLHKETKTERQSALENIVDLISRQGIDQEELVSKIKALRLADGSSYSDSEVRTAVQSQLGKGNVVTQ